MMKVYKIRNKEGLFSTGGLYPRWKKVGKTWVALQHINAHIAMLCKRYNQYKGTIYCRSIQFPYTGCMVIEYVTEENAIGICSSEGKIQMELVDHGPKS